MRIYNLLLNILEKIKQNRTGIESIGLRVYPVGSIYLTVTNANPGTIFGGTWTKVSEGRALFGSGQCTPDGITYVAGNRVEAGLPNLSGKAGRSYSDYNLNNPDYANFVSDPFYYRESESWGTSCDTRSGTYDACRNIYFDASRLNNIYGNSNTVQPNAYVVHVWQRTS